MDGSTFTLLLYPLSNQTLRNAMLEDYWTEVTEAYKTNKDQAVEVLLKILKNEKGRDFVARLDPEHVEVCIETLDHGLGLYELETSEGMCLLATLVTLSGNHMRLPKSATIESGIQVENKTLGRSTRTNTEAGIYKERAVAVKTLRPYQNPDHINLQREFCTQVALWSKLSHENVLKLVGARWGNEFVAVSELMAGSIMDYIKKNSVNRLELLHQAAQGLQYLHNLGIAHGRINGENILISNNKPPSACLADFGSSTMGRNTPLPTPCTVSSFMAPELLSSGADPTLQADIYAFGLVIYQVLTGKLPFGAISNTGLLFYLSEGGRPEKPEDYLDIGFSDSLWAFVQRCWVDDQDSRPKAADVVDCLGEVDWHKLMPACDQAMDVESDDGSFFLHHLFDNDADADEVSGCDTGSPTESESFGLGWSSSGFFGGSSSQTVTSLSSASHLDSNVSLPWQREGSHDDSIGWYPGKNRKPPSQLPTPERKKSLFRVLLPRLPGTKADAPSTLGPIGNLIGSTYTVAELITMSKKEPSQQLIDHIDKRLENLADDHSGPKRPDLLNALCKMCNSLGMVPTAMSLKISINDESEAEYFGCGTQVFKAEYDGRVVAAKVLTIYQESDHEESIKTFCREAVEWRHLRHPYILPLLGMSMDPKKDKFAMVSEWMVHGDIIGYVKKHAGVNPVQLLVEATTGLEYMHSLNMVHGDLKGGNILINSRGRACLADFGLSTMTHAGKTTRPFFASTESLVSFTPGGTVRWTSPELLDPINSGDKEGRPTKSSDCYALGMVVYEVLSREHPYHETNSLLVSELIRDGVRPKKPENAESLGFTEGLWNIVERCWLAKPADRPDVGTVLPHLNYATWFWDRRNWTAPQKCIMK